MTYSKGMKGSLATLTFLSDMDPAHPRYPSQIIRAFDVISHCLTRANRGGYAADPFETTTKLCDFLTTIYLKNNRMPSPALSSCFAKVWPAMWKNLQTTFIPCFTHKILAPIQTIRHSKNHFIDLLYTIGGDKQVISKMISTPGLNSLVFDLWSTEIDDTEEVLDANSTITGFIDVAIIHLSLSDPDNMDPFLSPMEGNLKSLATTALKHLHHASTYHPVSLHHLIWTIHIITVLSNSYEPISPIFLAQHRIASLSKVLCLLTAEPPPEEPCTEAIARLVSLKVGAIEYTLWNLVQGIVLADGLTWVIEALEAKFLIALVRCEPWIPLLNDLDMCLYPFLTDILPGYSAYCSCLHVMDKFITKIRESGLDSAGESHGGSEAQSSFWKDWNAFTALVKSRISILASAPGGLVRGTRDRCHNAIVGPMFYYYYF